MIQKTIEQRMREAMWLAERNGTSCPLADELRASLTMDQLDDRSRPCTIGTSRSMKNWIKKHSLVTERCCFHQIAHKPCDCSCYEIEKSLPLIEHTSVWRRNTDGELIFLTQPFDNDRDLVARFLEYACNFGLAVIIHFSNSSKFEGVIEVMRAENVKRLPRTTHAFITVRSKPTFSESSCDDSRAGTTQFTGTARRARPMPGVPHPVYHRGGNRVASPLGCTARRFTPARESRFSDDVRFGA